MGVAVSLQGQAHRCGDGESSVGSGEEGGRTSRGSRPLLCASRLRQLCHVEDRQYEGGDGFAGSHGLSFCACLSASRNRGGAWAFERTAHFTAHPQKRWSRKRMILNGITVNIEVWGRLTLDQHIGVRIPGRQPNNPHQSSNLQTRRLREVVRATVCPPLHACPWG